MENSLNASHSFRCDAGRAGKNVVTIRPEPWPATRRSSADIGWVLVPTSIADEAIELDATLRTRLLISESVDLFRQRQGPCVRRLLGDTSHPRLVDGNRLVDLPDPYGDPSRTDLLGLGEHVVRDESRLIGRIEDERDLEEVDAVAVLRDDLLLARTRVEDLLALHVRDVFAVLVDDSARFPQAVHSVNSTSAPIETAVTFLFRIASARRGKA